MKRAPQLIADLADTVAAEVARLGVDEEKAVDIGMAVAERIRQDWGGEPIYIPKGTMMDISKKHMQIFEEFKGANHVELAHKHGMTVIHIYRIVKSVRAALINERQGGLF